MTLLAACIFVACNPNSGEQNGGKDETQFFTVTFDTQGGSDVADITVEDGKAIGELTLPTKQCARLVGFALDADGERMWDVLTDTVSADITLYAIWEDAHDWGEWVVTKPATCTENGEKTRTCNACSETEKEVIPIAHTWGEWKTTTDPTCTEEGTKKHVCEICGKEETDGIPALGHDFAEEYTVDVEPGCETKGSESRHCTRCDATTDSREIAALGHIWGEWETVTPPTCTEEGTKKCVCEVCEKIKTADIPATGHTFSDAWSKDDTYHWHAATCGHTDEISEKAEHSWDDGVITKQPTCTEDGVMTYTCTVCEKTKTADIPATGHTFSEDWSYDDDYHWHAATCGDTDEVSEKAEHTWDNGVCSVCGTPKPSEGLNYALFGDGTGYSVTGIGTCTDTNIVIPSAYNDLPVTSIGNSAFEGCSSLTSINIPDNVTSIGNYAFEGCSSLTSINIPDSVTSIGYAAFRNCSSLTSITIPDSVTSIGNSAFNGCSSLESVTIGNGVTFISNSAFYGCSSLESVTMGNGVTSIGNYAFEGCSSIKSVYITDIAAWCNINFTTGTSNPLCYTANLYLNGELVTELIIPDGVTSISKHAFRNCSSLTSVTIPDSVTSIGDYAFYGCTSLTSIAIHDSVAYIGSYAFYGCSSLTSITIPDNVTSIGSYAFYGCSSLTSINIPDNVTSIDFSAFNGCSSLESVTIGNGVTSIGNFAFNGCSSLTSITIPDSVTYIGQYAFLKCSSLTSVTFKNTSGWYVSTSSTDTSGTDISSEDLADPATAVIYLKSTYNYQYWHRV